MRRILVVLVLVSIPTLLMLRVLQAYRFTAALENSKRFEAEQEEILEENRRLLAGIAVFSAPERVYEVGRKTLQLREPDPESVIQVHFPDGTEADR